MQHQRNTSSAAIKEQLLSGDITLAQLSIAEVEKLLEYEIDQVSSECLCNDDLLLACTKCLEEQITLGNFRAKKNLWLALKN